MSKRARVVWSEGLLLAPQHLQHLDRYHEERAAELYRAGRPFGHGLSALELDADAIHNGQIVLHRAAGVLPGGVAFSIPDRDDAPSGRSIGSAFAITETRFPIYLGLRIHRPGEAQLGGGGAADGDRRFRETTEKSPDETTGENEREIRISRPNFRILFPNESLGDYDHIPIAEVVRKPEGGYTYRADYMPPSVSAEASEFLLRTLRRLLEILVAKSTELSDRRRYSGKGIAEFGRDDVAGFWLLGTVNGYVPLLAHLLRARNAHPEAVYMTLARLAGELTTMSDQPVRDIPPYDHDRPESTFADLGARIPKLLETVLPRHYTRIALARRDEAVHTGRIDDDRLLDPAVAFYLGAYANMPAADLQVSFPGKVKIASPDRIDLLVASALPGLPVRHVPSLPPSLPVQSGYVYFQLDKVGDFWDLIAGARSLAIYTPPEFPNIHMELVAIRD